MPGYPVASSGFRLPEVHTLRSADKAFRGGGEDEGVEVIVEVDGVGSLGCGVILLVAGDLEGVLPLQFLNHPTRLTKDMVCLFVSSLCSREGSFRNCRGKITSAS